jgi:pyruvate formate lyase activating enzyme
MATTIGDLLDTLTVRGELYRKLSDDTIECYACGHRCKIREGKRGICQVRFNQGGELRVPWGYVAALQSDPIEKKPFFHVNPGSNALTFGMLGCDFHCGYCFTGDTMVVTNRGPVALQDAFELGVTIQEQPDGDIAIPHELQAITSSGNLRKVKAVFRHPYEGKMVKIMPYDLPAITCTPDHRVYVTDDVNIEPYKIQAKNLKLNQYLVVPRRFNFPSLSGIDAMEYIASHKEQIFCRESREFARVSFEPSREFVQFVAEGSSFSQNRMVTRHANIDLEPNMIQTERFYLVPVREIEHESFKGHVFNMEVEEEHNYLANFLLVSNCQNWLTSQAMRDPDSDISANYIRKITPQEMVQLAHRTHASTVVSSYNEPLITSEWAVGIFKEAKSAGLMCAYVSNGNNTPEVMEYIRPYISAYKVDLKCMQDKNYRKLGGVLQNTLDGIKRAHELGLWVEIVTLTIPGFNDSNEELWDAARFIAGVSREIPWHVTAFHKDYKMTDHDNTDARTLLRAAEIGREAGLQFVYAGNLPGQIGEYEDTFCPNCNQRLIQRTGYILHEYRITGEGTCPKCNTRIPGLWPKDPSQVVLNGLGIPLPVR